MIVVVWQPAYLGDVVFASPVTAAIRRARPEARIVFVARPPGDDVARRLPGVTDVWGYDKYGADRGLAAARRMGLEIRTLQPDLFLSLHGSVRSGFVARASRVERTFGPAGAPGSFLFRKRVPVAGLGFAARAKAIAEAAGFPADEALRLELSDVERAEGARIAGEGPALALIPGSAWETKRWPAAHAAELARRFLARGVRVVLLGSPSERPLCAQIAAAAPGCLDLCGGPVSEALAVLSACRAAVGGDSGLVHAARALGVPTAVLFGPTDPALHRAADREVFVHLGLPCAPCSDHGGRRCPLGHHSCLRDLGAGRVEDALVPLLGA